MIFRNQDISYGVALIREFPCGLQIAFSDYSSLFDPMKYYSKLTDLISIYLGYASKLPENLMLLHGVVIFLEFFATKTFLIVALIRVLPIGQTDCIL